MSGTARSKVDQQILICQELVRLTDIYGQSAAILTSLCLQLELGICFYMAEVQHGKKVAPQLWNLDREYINDAQNPSVPELAELADLAQESTSWLSLFLDYLCLLRQFDQSSPLKGEIFESDLQISAQAPLIASSRKRRLATIELADLVKALERFQELVIRQRLSREEY